MSTGSLERGSQPPTNAPRTPTTQLVVSQASLLNSTPLNRGTPTQDGEAKIPLYARTGLVGRATTVYECDLEDHPSKELVVTLSWSEVSGTLEPEVLKELGGIPEQEVKGHIPALLASEMSTVMDTCLIRKRLCTRPQLHFPRPLVITVCQKRLAVWDFTADDFFNAWMGTLSCHITLWGKSFHHYDTSPGNMMYDCEGDNVVGVLNYWDLATVFSSSTTPNTDRTGTIPFMALQLLSGKRVVPMFRHDVESFFWLFLWVCGCPDGSRREVLVAPYKVWRKLDMHACKIERGSFLSAVNLDDLNVSEHHATNGLSCLFRAWLLQQLSAYTWNNAPTSMDHSGQEQKDMAIFQAIFPKFWEVRVELDRKFSPKDWFDDEHRLLDSKVYSPHRACDH